MSELDPIRQHLYRGETRRAQELLEAYVRQQPEDSAAWLLLAEIHPDPQVQKHALEQVLARDPANQAAVAALRPLKRPPTGQQHLPDWLTTPATPEQQHNVRPTAQLKKLAYLSAALLALMIVGVKLFMPERTPDLTFAPGTPATAELDAQVRGFFTEWMRTTFEATLFNEDERQAALEQVAERYIIADDHGYFVADQMDRIETALLENPYRPTQSLETLSIVGPISMQWMNGDDAQVDISHLRLQLTYVGDTAPAFDQRITGARWMRLHREAGRWRIDY